MIPSSPMNNQETGSEKSNKTQQTQTFDLHPHGPHAEALAEQWAQWIRKILIVVAVIGAGGLGYLGYDNYRHSQGQNAFDELFRAEKIEEIANREASALKVSALEVMKNWPEEKKVEFSTKLQSVMDRFKGTTAGTLAGFKLGRWNLDLQKFTEAETVYRQLLKTTQSGSSEENLLRSMAVEGLAVSLENQNKLDEAKKSYEEGLTLKANPLRPMLLLGAARISSALGDVEQSRGHYQNVVKEFPDSDFEKRARALLAYLDLKNQGT